MSSCNKLIKSSFYQVIILSWYFYFSGRQDPDGRGDRGELCHPQRGAQEAGALHALAHQVWSWSDRSSLNRKKVLDLEPIVAMMNHEHKESNTVKLHFRKKRSF